jgi:hypothetical protein
MTYTELVNAIQEYTENYESTFVANIPVFIQQTETRVYNTVQLPSIRRNSVGTLSANDKYLAAPNDFLSVYSFAVIENYGTASERYHYLLNKDVNYLREAYPTPADTGLPQYYAIFGPKVVGSTTTDELSFILGPTPDDAYYVELHYYYYPESITVAADGRTWLGDNYDPVLLYGALREAYLFMKGETDLIQNVEAKYNEAVAELKRLGDGLERQDAYRSGQVRIPVT